MRAVSWTLTRLPGAILEESVRYLGFCVRDGCGCGWLVCATGVLSGRRVSSELFADEILQENNRTAEKLTRVRVGVVLCWKNCAFLLLYVR
jgi:hypothetical protein